MKCQYCNYWITSKKTYREKKNSPLQKFCSATKEYKFLDDKRCKYFHPVDTFYCDKNNDRQHFVICLQRRRNPKKLGAFDDCKSCRQFELEILPIINEYYIERKKIKKPKKKNNPSSKIKRRKKPIRKIKRRKKPEVVVEVKRIKRRKKPIRKIKRRKEAKSGRKIKRRKQ